MPNWKVRFRSYPVRGTVIPTKIAKSNYCVPLSSQRPPSINQTFFDLYCHTSIDERASRYAIATGDIPATGGATRRSTHEFPGCNTITKYRTSQGAMSTPCHTLLFTISCHVPLFVHVYALKVYLPISFVICICVFVCTLIKLDTCTFCVP